MEWEDSKSSEDEAMILLDQFINSDIYKQICRDAESGDDDSVETLEKLASHLSALCFHLKNESGMDRIGYELNSLQKYIASWE